MKTEFLQNIGVTEKTVIDAIMAENGKDINGFKSRIEALESEANELKNQLSGRDAQLAELKKSVKDNEGLTNKITELETANANAKIEYENKINQMQKTYAIENGIREVKGKNIKAVMALLDVDKITFEGGKLNGLSSQLDALIKNEDTNFLFG